MLRKTKFLLTIFILFFSLNVYAGTISNYGRSFSFGFMENLNPSLNGAPMYGLHISTLADSEVKIEIPGQSFEHRIQISAGSSYKYYFPFSDLEPRGGAVISDLAIYVKSDQPISVVAVHNRLYFSSTTLLLPDEALGANHYVIAAKDNSSLNSPSSFLIVARYNNTTVKVRLGTGGHAGILKMNLNRGQTYQIQNVKNLSGSQVSSNRAVAVFSGAKRASLNVYNDDSHVYFSLPPVRFADTVFFARSNLHLHDATFVQLLATQGQTTCWVNGDEIQLNQAGDYQIVKIAGSTKIQSSKPVLVAQMNAGIGGNSVGAGPSMSIITSPNHGTKISRFVTKDNVSRQLKHSLSLFTYDTTGLEIDGQQNLGFAPFGTDGVFYLQMDIDKGTHTIKSQSPFWGQAYGFSFADYYVFNLGFEGVQTGFQGYGDECAEVNVYPNPGNGMISITQNGLPPDLSSITVYDALGRKVFINNVRQVGSDIDVSSLAPGAYFIQSSCGKTKKFIVSGDR